MGDFLTELEWRGLVDQLSDRAGIAALRPGESFYGGFDPSAPSLHVGNLVPLMVALHIGTAGLKPLLLFGGATGAIGDPSGKRTERPLLDRREIDANIERIAAQAHAIFARRGIEAEVVNNYEWTAPVTVLEFLREVGKHFTVNYMMGKESVKTRLADEGISFTEFSYMLLQAFDFYHLFSTRKCRLQIGGSDQWGNITAGLELIRKKGGGEAYALSAPLLTTSDGRKFGKTEAGAVWLDPERTSPYRFHQYWLNTPDADVVRYLKIFTLLPRERIEELEREASAHPDRRAAQRALADAVTAMVHGDAATAEAQRSAEVLFGGSLDGIPESKLAEIFADVPSVTLPRAATLGKSVLDLFVDAGAAKSKGEARRLVAGGGAYIDNRRVSDEKATAGSFAAEGSSMLVLRSGKKSYFLVRLSQE